MFTLEEYFEKKKEADKKVLKLLSGDLGEDTVYELLCYDRRSAGAKSRGVFKKYVNLKREMEFEISGSADINGERSSDYRWFEIKKFGICDGEYEEIFSIRMNYDGKLLHYLPSSEALDSVQIPLAKNVIMPFETGDILKVKNKPLSEDYYIIYVYDKNQQGNKHIQMCFEDAIKFYKIHFFELLERVETCPIERINKMSKSIKENPNGFWEFYEKQKVLPNIRPF